MKQYIIPYCKLMRWDKPIGVLLLLWPTLWAMWFIGWPKLQLLVVFILGVFFMRSAGCIINDLADRKFDINVERTKNRPLVNGDITIKKAMIAFVTLIVLSVLLLLTLPPLAWVIACFAFLMTLIYPFMKRFVYYPQLVLGFAFSCSILMVYASTLDSLPLNCWLLFLANICWTIAYDTIYAMVDRDDDLKIGVKSTAILFGEKDKLIIAVLQTITLLLLMIAGLICQLSAYFYLSLLVSAGLFVYQQVMISDRKRECCFKAFLNNNYVGLSIFAGLLLNAL